MKDYYLAIDLGGTNIKISVFLAKSREEILRESIPAYSQKGIVQALTRVAALVEQKNISGFKELGIAIPGIVDRKKKTLRSDNGKYSDAVAFDFQGYCLKLFGCDPIMDNDANTALEGEIFYGCARGYQNVVMMILGTGIGTAAFMEGKAVRGCHDQAAILGGHFLIDPEGKKCNCGSRGCVEAYAGVAEIRERVKGRSGFSKSLVASKEDITMKELLQAAEEGDAFALQQIKMQIKYYTVCLTNLIYAYDPECVVLSGGILNGQKDLAKQLEDNVKLHLWREWGAVEFQVAREPSRSVILGLLHKMECVDKEGRK